MARSKGLSEGGGPYMYVAVDSSYGLCPVRPQRQYR